MFKIKLLWCLCLLFWISNAKSQNLKLVSSNNSQLQYMGRVLQTDSSTQFFWCGTSVTIKVKNTQNVKVLLSENIDLNYYNVVIDGKYLKKIKTLKGKKVYQLAEGLSAKPHSIELFKVTNTDERISNFYGFIVDQGATILKQKIKQPIKMEYFGDSITAGHGIEVPDGMPDNGLPEYFNNYLTYAAITSRCFQAQYHNTSKSGIGITVSWDRAIMPEIYDRLNPNDSLSKWDFSKYQPDIVVVNLFQNDYSLVNMPLHAQFKKRFGNVKPNEEFLIKAYIDFIVSLRNVYPKAKIICALGNMDVVKKDSPWPGYINSAVASLKDSKIYVKIFKIKNTTGHPRIQEQEAMADELIRFIKDNKIDK
ncbi:GDSL-type esterase/lipase family protein [Pedobacter sp. Leaf194]|uniref:GDSL-type esterase/lipase family protein n=1 Tax=Pedobacter sp. Leaf194 TaxID=1736297 RepID=UPI0007033FEF|nr:GDSL-type esterase/lipase family protein [Pedobacter sp. Leaf194]KQS36784.1 hypothetical protein ASG14_07030 [Pedobacter sp. Leaf194]